MPLIPNIMELFGKTPAAAPIPPVPPTPGSAASGNPLAPSTETPISDGSVKAIPAAGAGEKSPLENFHKLWDAPDPTTVTAEPSLTPSYNIDPKIVREAAAKINFTGNIAQATVDKALAGDKAAFMQVINTAAQNGFAQSSETTARIVEAALTKQADTLLNHTFPSMQRKQQVSTTVAAENPIFENPAVAPILSMLRDQLATKHPTDTPARIAEMAKEVLVGMSTEVLTANGKQITLAPDPAKTTGGKKETDWETYFK